MVNGPRGDLVISSESDEDRQARRIGRGPGVRTLLVNGHIPNSCGVGAPLPTFQVGMIKLVKPAAIFFEHQHMTITVARFGIAFDQRVGGNWFGPWIAFTCERSQGHRYFRLSSGYDLIGNTNRLVVKGARAEIRMERYRASDVDRKSTRLNSSHSQISYAV